MTVNINNDIVDDIIMLFLCPQPCPKPVTEAFLASIMPLPRDI